MRVWLLRLIISLLVWSCVSRVFFASATDTPRTSSPPNNLLPAAPGLTGFGTETPAGSGRNLPQPKALVYRVTSLADSGPGTLRHCILQRGPRTCIFEVGGIVRLRGTLSVRSPFLTVAGQTAPPPGITITQAGFSIETHDVLLQHLSIRPGDSPVGAPPSNRDGVSIGSGRMNRAFNVVLDHLSISWAIDENISTWYPGTHDITISNCLIAEGLHRSIHPKGPHSKGVMIGDGSKRVTLYRNLLTWNEERNPYIKPGSSAEVINNVVYGWGSNGGWSLCNISNNDKSAEKIELSFIGNTYIPGPSSFETYPLYGKNTAPGSLIFAHDNLPHRLSPAASRMQTTDALCKDGCETISPPVQSPHTQATSADASMQTVLSEVGSRPRHRSTIDQRLVNQVRNRTGELKDCITGCAHSTGPLRNTTPRHRRLRTPRAPFGDRNGDGYTNLENWLHRLSSRL